MSRHPTSRPKDGARPDQPMPHNCDRTACKMRKSKIKYGVCKLSRFNLLPEDLSRKKGRKKKKVITERKFTAWEKNLAKEEN